MAPNTEFEVSDSLRGRLLEIGTKKMFRAGETVLNENSYIRAIPIVMSGSIRVLRMDDDGREMLLYYIRAGESCIMSFLGGMHGDTSKVHAVAEEDSEILFVPVAKLPELMRDFPEWLDFIFRLYHKRFEELLEVVNNIAFKKLDERLIDYLERKAELSGSTTISITHDQLAQELGSARVVISRLLKQLENEGRVELGRNKIVLK